MPRNQTRTRPLATPPTRPWLICLSLVIALVAPSFADDMPARPNLTAVPFNDVTVRDTFWAPRQEINRTVSIPVNLAELEKAGNLRNLRLAAQGKREGFTGPVFMDSDIYKALEAASYSLAVHPDADLDRQLDEIIATLAAAQQPDGYLNSHFIVKEPDRRWTNLRDAHELYCAGHLFEAAVAHHRATGKTTFLDIARKLADHIDRTFGPGKRMGYPGHPEIELALVKLADLTGESRYFDLAKFFVMNRGRKFFAEEHRIPLDKYDGEYTQDDVPITEHRSIKGHAVRAAYLMSGATDVAARTGDEALLRMLNRVWRNTAHKNMYITGGIGPSAHNEGFTTDYDLPNLTAYQETCASVALAQWNHRLALLYADAKYADVMERSLYNGVLAGVSLDGNKFFYVNPLESRGTHHRAPWFGCACCPPNVARTLASLGGYAYAVGPDSLTVNLYVQGSATTRVAGAKVVLDVETTYPWDGQVTIRPKLEKPTPFALRLRVPGWCQGATIAINGAPTAPKIERGYFVAKAEWNTGDTITLNLPMPVERVAANPNVKADAGLVALQRGPIVYGFEQADNPGVPLSDLFLPPTSEFTAEKKPDLLGGVVVLTGKAAVSSSPDWSGTLYQAIETPTLKPVTLIPYFAWDNREPGAMKVWLPTAPTPSLPGGPETRARVTMSFVNNNCQPHGVNDGKPIKSSSEQPDALAHWWPHRGGTEWIQYTWPKPITIGAAAAYWFDDTGRGACRLPVSWHLEYRDGDAWKPVNTDATHDVTPDRFCRVAFDPVTTSALRLVVQMRPDWAAGVHEWTVEESDED